jgi:WG containing repeat
MKALLFSLSFLLLSSSFAQVMSVGNGGLSYEDGKGTSLMKPLYEECWCTVSKRDSLGNPTELKPITYPLPVKLDGEWRFISKDRSQMVDPGSGELSLMTKSGRVMLKGFSSKNHEWSAAEDATLELLDSAGSVKTTYLVEDHYEGTFLVTESQKDWGLLDSDLKVVLPIEYIAVHADGDQFKFNSKGVLTLRKNEPGSYYGAVNHKGKTIIPFKWKLISYIIEDEEHIYVMNEYLKRGYINIKGQTTLPFKYSSIPRVLKDSNKVTTEHYIYFLDKNLKQLGPRYQSFEKKGDVYFYKRDNKWGVLNKQYEEVIPRVYTSIMDGPRIKGNLDFKCYIVVKNGLYGLITTEGETIIKPTYECLCGLSYFAPSAYYIEFKKAGVSYKFSETGELIEKGGKGSKACFCE